ncbi:MAG: hypothetical protein LCH93_13585 [Proteobacteria bacterium]|nr:hypothetical protein [Pseudomonadota bacterium]
MTVAEANALRWALFTVATLAFAQGSVDVVRWRQDNGRYLERIKERHPRLYELLDEAAEAMAKVPLPAPR